MMTNRSTESPFVLAACGASGQIFAKWVLKFLIERQSAPVHVIVSAAAEKIIRDELKTQHLWTELPADRLVIENEKNMESVLASGSVPTSGMMVCPCSLNTLAALAAGMSDTLIRRAAQVHLKQRRKLVIAVREMPLSLIDLENMVRLTQAGAIVTPISPSFYHHPATLDDLASFTAERLVNLLTDIPSQVQYHP
jgi:polyprenyl P-hydroxybenzoate/phenylacrylic acid decarboxylase-like protein